MSRAHFLHQRHRRDQGAVLVEFALVLPIFALMLFAMVQFGVLFAGWAQLRNAVQTGARMTSLGEQSPACGSLSLPTCTDAILIGRPIGLALSAGNVTSVVIDNPDQAQCTSPLATCTDASWLDGYYIYQNGAWEQVVSAATSSPSPGQIADQSALIAATSSPGTWSCAGTDPAGYCTEITTAGSNGTAVPALGSDYGNIAVECLPAAPSCGANSQVLVCASFPAAAFSGLLPSITVFSESDLYMETGTATTANQGGISCG